MTTNATSQQVGRSLARLIATVRRMPQPQRKPQFGSDALVRRIAGMTREAMQASINASHPVEQIADLGNVETQRCLEADALAMSLIQGKHDKREIVNMIRWILMGAPNTPNNQTQE